MSKKIRLRPKATAKISNLKDRCPSGKIRFRDRKEGIAALHRAENIRNTVVLVGEATRRREVRCYDCNLCGGVHLSSKATWSERKEAA